MHRNEKSTRQNSVWRVILRLCVIFSLWQGPVPWLHCHESDLSDSASPASIVELRCHLEAFHNGMALDLDHDFGWHFHWIFPGWSDGFHELSNDGQPANGFANLDSIVACSIIPASIDGLFNGDLCQCRSVPKFTNDSQIIFHFELCRLPRRQHELPLVMRC